MLDIIIDTKNESIASSIMYWKIKRYHFMK